MCVYSVCKLRLPALRARPPPEPADQQSAYMPNYVVVNSSGGSSQSELEAWPEPSTAYEFDELLEACLREVPGRAVVSDPVLPA